MWLEVTYPFLAVRQEGFIVIPQESGALYVCPGLERLGNIRELASSEYGQAVQIDLHNEIVHFGRDYLGQHPLIFAHTSDKLFVSDEHSDVVTWLTNNGVQPSLSEESLALYLTMGYVPQGVSLYEQITPCENATLYRWEKGRILKDDLFSPVDEDPNFRVEELADCIESEMDRYCAGVDDVDVWCSGGLDSSVIAACANTSGRKADLLTLIYDDNVRTIVGDGELPFAEEAAAHCGSPLHVVKLTQDVYRNAFRQHSEGHISPTIDLCVLPKYALASGTRHTAITGEGADPLFAGTKNNTVLYVHDRHPNTSLGWIYAMSHRRSAGILGKVLKRGDELQGYVVEYFDKMFQQYPGSLLRKLFYMNTFAKLGGMIFCENYYASKRFNIKARHPLAARSVYDAAFRLSDEKKYIYPKGKLALIDSYRKMLPASIIERPKSGTQLPLAMYLEYITPEVAGMEAIRESELFKEGIYERLMHPVTGLRSDVLLNYGLATLEGWLGYNNKRIGGARAVDHTRKSDNRESVVLS